MNKKVGLNKFLVAGKVVRLVNAERCEWHEAVVVDGVEKDTPIGKGHTRSAGAVRTLGGELTGELVAEPDGRAQHERQQSKPHATDLNNVVPARREDAVAQPHAVVVAAAEAEVVREKYQELKKRGVKEGDLELSVPL